MFYVYGEYESNVVLVEKKLYAILLWRKCLEKWGTSGMNNRNSAPEGERRMHFVLTQADRQTDRQANNSAWVRLKALFQSRDLFLFQTSSFCETKRNLFCYHKISSRLAILRVVKQANHVTWVWNFCIDRTVKKDIGLTVFLSILSHEWFGVCIHCANPPQTVNIIKGKPFKNQRTL